MNIGPFVSRPHTYGMNVADGKHVSAGPATLTSPTGPEPGIIIRRGSQIHFVIPAEDAIRLANEIADAVEAHDQAAA